LLLAVTASVSTVDWLLCVDDLLLVNGLLNGVTAIDWLLDSISAVGTTVLDTGAVSGSVTMSGVGNGGRVR